MNQQKFDSIYRGLSEQSKKIYDCIPISEAWSPAQLMAELHRKSISLGDYRVVMGCVNLMLDSGLIVEVSRGMFKREVIRAKIDSKDQIQKTVKDSQMQTPQKPIAQQVGALDRLSSFASRLRDLANDMENAAIELAGQAERNDAETAKMRQLQAILKSLG